MSISYRVYLGPYIEAKVFEKTITRHRVSCPNEQCDSHGRRMHYEKYCPNCGSKISEVPSTEIAYQAVNSHLRDDELTDDQVDRFYERMGTISGICGMNYSDYPFDIYIANRGLSEVENRNFKRLSFDPLSCERVIEPVEQNMMVREMNAFKREYAEEIELVTQWHGIENVNIKWGLLSWA